MSDRHRSVLVGAFAVGALVIAAAGALFVTGGGLGTPRSRVIMAFEESLRGLNVGAPVALRGVTVGQVTGIQLLLDPMAGDLTMLVEAELNPDNVQLTNEVDEADITQDLVAHGLRAQLGTQSLLTGLLYVQLDFFPDSAARLAEIDSPLPQIPTIPTELEQLLASLETVDFARIATSIDRIASGLESLLNSGPMQALPGALTDTLTAVERASDDLSATLDASGPKLDALLGHGGNLLAELQQQLPQLLGSVETALAQLGDTLDATEAGMQGVESTLRPGSSTRQQITTALQELTLAARSLRALARSIDERPESLLRGRGGERKP